MFYSDNTVVAEKLNTFFVEAVQCLEIEPHLSQAEINACGWNIEEMIKLYERHPSILKIKEHVYNLYSMIQLHKICVDSTTYTSEENIESLLKTSQEETSIVLKWFNVNVMKSNDDKCHLIFENQDNISITVGNKFIEAEDSAELLGIKVDKNLNFNEHVSDLMRKSKVTRVG